MRGELEAGRSLPYGPYSGVAEKAHEELTELRADMPDPALWERKQSVGDALVNGLEQLEANPDDPALWTTLADLVTEWRSLSRVPTHLPTHGDDESPF